MTLIDGFICNYSEDYILREIYKNRDMIFPNSFLNGLETALLNIKTLSENAYNDFVGHKLKATKKDSFDIHSLLSSLCELEIMNSFIQNSEKKKSFMYEPQLREDNNKNVEFSIVINDIKYNVEVKSLNFENYNKKLNKLVKEKGSILHYETRMIDLTEEEKVENITSTDSKVKRTYNTIDLYIIIDIPYIFRSDGGRLKDMLRVSCF